MLKKLLAVLVFVCMIITSMNILVFADNETQISNITSSTLTTGVGKIGDVNGDNEVNSTDITWMKRYILKIINDFPVEDDLWAADVDGDTFINSTDFSWMKKYVLNIINKFPKEPDGNVIQMESGLSHSIILKDDGTVWSLGNNNRGQLGLGQALNQNEPVMISGLTDIISITAGNEHSLAFKKDGTLWAWGNNNEFQLIDNTESNPDTGERICNTPFDVKTHLGVRLIRAGFGRTLFVKNDGALWLYALRSISSSGSSVYFPWEIKGIENIKAAEVGGTHIVTLKEDGTVWSWGDNLWGQMGDGSQQHHNVYDYSLYKPLQASYLTGITAIAAGSTHSVALKDDGMVWTWGGNFHGQLGDGTDTYKLWPQKVEGLENIIAIEAGNGHTVALKADGTVWVWGKNDFGQLGNGSTFRSRIPIQVEGITDVKAISAGIESTMVLKADGTVWAWGKNDFGQLGDGTNENKLIPVQVIIP